MKTILETTQLEFDKSDFLIDLVEHENGQLYIEIVQTILNTNKKAESIKINPSVLSDIIKVLQNYQAKLPKEWKLELKHITENDQEKIQSSYLKGVSIKDLVNKVVKASGKSLEINHDLLQPSIKTSLFLDCTFAEKELGWKPQITIDDGIQRTIEWWSDNIDPLTLKLRITG